MSRNTQEELVHFLSDMYSVELQALAQLKAAPEMAGDPGLATDYQMHCTETETHAERVRERLEALGGSPSAVKDAVMKLGGKGFLLFAKMQSETPGRLLAHSYSYEAMEWAGYAVLIRLAELGGDPATAETARFVQAEERAMMERLARGYDAAEGVSHRDVPSEKLAKHVCEHLAEAHALTAQSAKLLERGAKISDDPEVASLYKQPLAETRQQLQRLEDRMKTLGSSPSALQDAALKLGALNWSSFFHAQSDTPCKLLAFTYAVEHLVIAGLELLRRTARRANDAATEQLCEELVAEKHAIAKRLAQGVSLSVEATLRATRK